MKMEASGWPSWVKSDEDRQKYLDDFEEREGFSLDASKISKNPGTNMRVFTLCITNKIDFEPSDNFDLSISGV